MRVTIVPPDKKITVDGRQLTVSDEEWNFDDNHIHAIQWYDDHGELEWVTTDPNEKLTSIDIAQPYIDYFFEEIPKIEQIRIQKEEAARQQLQDEIDSRAQAEIEKQELMKKIRETAEENRRIAEVAREKERREQELLDQIYDRERNLQIERELKEKEIQKARIDAEISLREETAFAAMREEREALNSLDNEIAAKQEQLNSMFETQIREIEERKQSVDSIINEERELLESQRREYLSQVSRAQEDLELQQQEVELKSIELTNRRNEIELESARAAEEHRLGEERRETEKEDFIRSHELAIDNYQKQIEYFQSEKEIMERELKVESERVALIEKEYEIQKQNVDLQSELLEREKDEFNRLLEIERDVVESNLYEDRARDAAIKLAEEQAQKDLQEQLIQKNTEIVNRVAANTDPLLLLNQIARDPDLDIANFPVTEILGWFSQLKKVQDFCGKYGLTYQQVMGNPELKALLEDTMIE